MRRSKKELRRESPFASQQRQHLPGRCSVSSLLTCRLPCKRPRRVRCLLPRLREKALLIDPQGARARFGASIANLGRRRRSASGSEPLAREIGLGENGSGNLWRSARLLAAGAREGFPRSRFRARCPRSPRSALASRLLSNDEPLDWATNERGLTLDTIRRFQPATTARRPRNHNPISSPDEEGEWLHVRRRFLDPRPIRRSLACPGARSPLSARRARTRIRARSSSARANLTAILLNQLRYPALTSTAGTSWKAEVERVIAGRRVAVLYDAGSNEKRRARRGARKTAGAKRSVGCESRA